MLSRWVDFSNSKNLTFRQRVRSSLPVPIHHYLSPKYQQDRTETYCYSMLMYSRTRLLETLYFSQGKPLQIPTRTDKTNTNLGRRRAGQGLTEGRTGPGPSAAAGEWDRAVTPRLAHLTLTTILKDNETCNERPATRRSEHKVSSNQGKQNGI